MAYDLTPYGGATYGGGRDPRVAGATPIVDPSRPDLPGYTWLTQVGPGPYGGVAYAGGGAPERAASGGIRVVTDASRGQVRLEAWWSGAPFLRLMRVVDGVGTALRRGYPVRVDVPTRRNLVTNPSFEADDVGYLAGVNTTLTRETGPTLAGDHFGRLTATADGAVSVGVPMLLPTAEPFAVSLAVRLSAAPTGDLTLTAAWRDQNGALMTPSVATVPAAELGAHVGRWDRTATFTLAPPPGGEGGEIPVQGSMTVAVDGMPAGGTVDLDAVLVEAAADAGPGGYFDGDSTYGLWTGLPHGSTSAVPTPVAVVDDEAPLDVPIRYELSAPDQPAFRALSEPVVLASRGRTWLTHPGGAPPLRVEPQAAPTEDYAIVRGLHHIIGRRRPLAVTAAARQSEAGTLVVPVANFGERDRLKELLADGQPLLLRAPAEFGRGPGQWISIGDVQIEAPGHGAWDGTRRFTLPYVECDPPITPDSTAVA